MEQSAEHFCKFNNIQETNDHFNLKKLIAEEDINTAKTKLGINILDANELNKYIC